MDRKKATKVPKPSLRDRILADLREGAEGVKRWNARKFTERFKSSPYHQVDLSTAQLRGVDLSSPFLEEGKRLDFSGTSFDGATLTEANLDHTIFAQGSFKNAQCQQVRLRGAQCPAANFDGANFQNAKMRATLFNKTSFQGSDLSGADLSHADLCAADLSTANLTGTKLDYAKYDKYTQFPAGFKVPDSMERVDVAPPSQPVATPSGQVVVQDKSGFLKKLEKLVDPGRLARALEMLRAESFQLFSQLSDTELVGVVKSQRDPDVVYSCRLTSEGRFHCCDQNLEQCLGLKGALCKHLMVLIVGLVRTTQLDGAQADKWVRASLEKKPNLNTDTASATLLRYKGAEAGEVDWRPTETIPEDYYAF